MFGGLYFGAGYFGAIKWALIVVTPPFTTPTNIRIDIQKDNSTFIKVGYN